jgi:hypothetical protein
MMAMLMVNYIVYDDDVSYFFDVFDIDHQLLMMMMMLKLVNAIDFDYYLVEIVCDDDDDDFCGDGDDDVYEIFSFSSFFYVSLLMTVK